jgi:hypothetical protein
MGLPLLLQIGIHKSNLGAVWDEVLLDVGEIVEVTREHGYVWFWQGVLCSCHCSGNTSTLSGSEWKVLVTCSRRTTNMLLLLEWSLVSCVVVTIWSTYQDSIGIWCRGFGFHVHDWICPSPLLACQVVEDGYACGALSPWYSIHQQSGQCRPNHIYWGCCTHLESLVPSHTSPVQGTRRSLCVADEHIQSCVLMS